MPNTINAATMVNVTQPLEIVHANDGWIGSKCDRQPGGCFRMCLISVSSDTAFVCDITRAYVGFITAALLRAAHQADDCMACDNSGW